MDQIQTEVVDQVVKENLANFHLQMVLEHSHFILEVEVETV